MVRCVISDHPPDHPPEHPLFPRVAGPGGTPPGPRRPPSSPAGPSASSPPKKKERRPLLWRRTRPVRFSVLSTTILSRAVRGTFLRHCAASPVVTPPHSVPEGSAVTAHCTFGPSPAVRANAAGGARAPRNEEEEGKEGRRCEGGQRGLDADRDKIKLTLFTISPLVGRCAPYLNPWSSPSRKAT